MFGWFRTPAARASCSKRFRRSASCEKDAGRTLIATSRPRRGSFARYTSPMPPAPRGPAISYGPSRVPEESVMERDGSSSTLLESLDDVEVGEVAQVGIGVGLPVRSDPDRADARHAGRVAGHQGAPGRDGSGFQIETVDLSGNLSPLL